MKKFLVLALGAVFVLFALVFAIVPGPSIVFLLAALVCFSIYYPKARDLLKIVQKIFKRACYRLDGIK
ncbi:hypothetical protein HG263_07430 [Pseudoalteromonas sp. JBTF-M23]|uniref:Uncharacterized protein n=1 Tax=Pseudoalteromonas caenipelagi TaxID=2726988 RepID=A0A849VAH1_9GAMM|nr:PGPGW domain-containing protein [Pseudoalteromonas caenipelagi]NOU50372.1 hypothetical protein [Pseudoalteromonas caenipelagi]